MKAYFIDTNEPVELAALHDLGVLTYNLNADTYEQDGTLEAICKERNYGHKSIVKINKEAMPNLDEMLAKFFTEHIHEFEEIRFFLDGSGFFDVRDKADRWVRIHVFKNDLIVLPAGIYHRFTLDENRHAIAMRLFLANTEPVWTPINRPEGDASTARSKYLSNFAQ